MSPEVWLALFTHHMTSGTPTSAEAALEQAAKLMPEPPRQLALAQGYEMLDALADAEQALKDAATAGPTTSRRSGAWPRFRFAKVPCTKARGLLEKILAAPDNADAAAAAKPWARRAMVEMEGTAGTYRGTPAGPDAARAKIGAVRARSPRKI